MIPAPVLRGDAIPKRGATRDHEAMFLRLMNAYCIPSGNLVFTDNIGSWCATRGLAEPDPDRLIRIMQDPEKGCVVLIREHIEDRAMAGRLNALFIRNQIRSVAEDPAEKLNSDKKRLAYLFLYEYAGTLPEIGEDELRADSWAFREMERLDFFRS